MNKEEPHRDQAERLRKRIDKIQDDTEVQLDSNGLPPRSEIHQQKNKKTKWKLKYPVIRLLLVFFTLLPIVSFSIYTINENDKRGSFKKVSNERQDYEIVDVEKNEETVPDIEDKKPGEEINIVETQSTDSINVIEAPEITNTTPDPKDRTPVKKKEIKIKYHKVQPEETLFRIAMKYYHSQSGIDIIKDANGIHGDEIQVGQTLKIPMK